jgi:16S rRNA C1402 (ribose-2'-O) methylase RsmI
MERVVATPIGASPSATLRALWVVGAAGGGV